MKHLFSFIKDEIINIFKSQKSTATLAIPTATTICIGTPLLLGAYFEHINYALLASLGSMIFLHTPNTNLMNKMVVLFCCSYGLILCFLLGIFANLYPNLIVLFITLVSMLVSSACAYFQLPPPGNFFFIMAFSISAFMPLSFAQNINTIGFVFMGTTLACLVGFIYGLLMLQKQKPTQKPPKPQKAFNLIITDSVITGFVIGLAIFIAIKLGFSRPYWVGISALAVLRGITYYAVVNRHFKRLVGTFFGLFLTMFLLPLDESLWILSFALMALVFLGQYFLSRNLLISITFLTPLSILFAEIGNFHLPVNELIHTRLYDTILGGSIGAIGGYLFHWERCYSKIDSTLKKLLLVR